MAASRLVSGAAELGRYVRAQARELTDYISATGRLTPSSLAIAGGFAVLGFAASFILYGMVPLAAQGANVWFEGDLWRVIDNMADSFSNHYRTKVHPLFPLINHPPVYILMTLGLSKELAIQLFVAATAGLWQGLMFLTLRALQMPRYAAAAWTLAALSSAASVFWIGVPETYLLGAVTFLPALALTARATDEDPPLLLTVLASATSLTMTISNWMVGIAAAFALYKPVKAARATADALLFVVLAWALQKALYPSAVFFLDFAEEFAYTSLGGAGGGGVLDRLVALLFHGQVMPPPILEATRYDSVRATVQRASLLFDHSFVGYVAVVAWAGALALGAHAMWRSRRHNAFRFVLLATLAGQVGMHLFYGEETFLYSLHLTPLLIFLAAYGATSRPRIAAALGLALAATAGFNNIARFEQTNAAIEIANPNVTIPTF